MIQTFCDVCKKQIGVEVSIAGTFYPCIPCDDGIYQSFVKDRHAHICCECEGILRKAVNDTVLKIRKEIHHG